ncbi:MAG: hypothetical protein QNK05_16940 [Myxococcota bacterium]|nr:hypothetical protein [Myxococcota bacterium]
MSSLALIAFALLTYGVSGHEIATRAPEPSLRDLLNELAERRPEPTGAETPIIVARPAGSQLPREVVIDGFEDGYAYLANFAPGERFEALQRRVCDAIEGPLAGAAHLLVIGGHDRRPVSRDHPLGYRTNSALSQHRAQEVERASENCPGDRRVTALVGGPLSFGGRVPSEDATDRNVRLVEVARGTWSGEVVVERFDRLPAGTSE